MMSNTNVNTASISQALFALGHTVDCVSGMRGLHRLSISHHIYGRPCRPNKSVRSQMNVLRDEHWAKMKALGITFEDSAWHILNKELCSKVDALRPPGRLGKPFNTKPAKERLEALWEAGKLTKLCYCGCPRNHRNSHMFSQELQMAINLWNKDSWANIDIKEFLMKMFGTRKLQAMLRLR